MKQSGEDKREGDEEQREGGGSQPAILGNLDQHPDQDGHHDQRVNDTKWEREQKSFSALLST